MEIIEAAVLLAAVGMGVLIGKIMSGRRTSIDPKKFKEVDEMEKKLLNAKIGYIQKSLDALMRRVGSAELEEEEGEEEANEPDIVKTIKELWNGLPSPLKVTVNMLLKSKFGMSVDELINNPTQLEFVIRDVAPKIMTQLAPKTVEEKKPVIDLSKIRTHADLEELVKNWDKYAGTGA